MLLSMQFLGLGRGKKWKILLGTGFWWLVWMNLKSVFAFGLLFGHRSLYNLGLILLSLFSNWKQQLVDARWFKNWKSGFVITFLPIRLWPLCRVCVFSAALPVVELPILVLCYVNKILFLFKIKKKKVKLLNIAVFELMKCMTLN